MKIDIQRILFKVERFLKYQEKYSVKSIAMLTGLILLFSENKIVNVNDVYKLSQTNFNQSINPKIFIELIKTINQNIEPKIKINVNNGEVYFETEDDIITSINQYNFSKLFNYSRDKYPLYQFRENVELYLYYIESHSEKREAMLTSLIILAKENEQVTYNNVVYFSEDYFDLTLGKTSFNSFIAQLNNNSDFNIRIIKQGKKSIYCNLSDIANKINAFRIPVIEKPITREKEPIDLTLIKRNDKGELEMSPFLEHIFREYQLRIDDIMQNKEIHEIVFDDIYNLLVNHNIYTDKRASMLTSLVILLRSTSPVDLDKIRSLADNKLYGSLKSSQFNKFLRTLNSFSPSIIEIDKSKYGCDDLDGLNEFIEEHRSKAIKLENILHMLSEDLNNNSEIKKFDELILRKDTYLEIGTELFTKIVKKFITQKVLLIAAAKLKITILNDRIVLTENIDQMYLLDFAMNDINLKITAKALNKYKNVNRKYLNLSTNLIKRYKVLIGVNSQEEVLIDQWISSKLSIFEIVEINPPLITVKDLLNSDSDLQTVIDRNLSQTAEINMIWAFRLTKFEELGATSGISFIFSADYKDLLLRKWRNITRKSKNKRQNQLLFIYLFEMQKKFGLDIDSEIFM